jgi:hypothetical protein
VSRIPGGLITIDDVQAMNFREWEEPGPDKMRITGVWHLF